MSQNSGIHIIRRRPVREFTILSQASRTPCSLVRYGLTGFDPQFQQPAEVRKLLLIALWNLVAITLVVTSRVPLGDIAS